MFFLLKNKKKTVYTEDEKCRLRRAYTANALIDSKESNRFVCGRLHGDAKHAGKPVTAHRGRDGFTLVLQTSVYVFCFVLVLFCVVYVFVKIGIFLEKNQRS